ncbi:MAG: type II secretion system F family protein [Nanoarchaeota archaeon]|nr:type II secretion system F family protein [Nanoarchaeota archaeon]
MSKHIPNKNHLKKKHKKVIETAQKLITKEPETEHTKIKPKLNIFNILRKKKVTDNNKNLKNQLEDVIAKKAKEPETEHTKIKFGILSFFKEKKADEVKGIEYFKKQVKKRATVLERRHKLRFYLERAGLGIRPEALSKNIFNINVFINLVISAFLIYHFSTSYGITWTTILASIIALWILVFIILLFILWVLFYIVVDLKIFKRKVDIEDVLPDYLQLTASNIKAGMTIDRALWYAVRPRFGVLAKEIEIVAKETMRGEDLKTALQKFADKYESVLLKRSISLLIEGLEAGGEIGNLLNKIAINIQENKIMKKEMSANVTTYVIFISFATIAAAPVLFALSGVLIRVITNLGSSLGDVTTAASTAGLALSFSGAGIKYSDFRIFALVSLIITSFFSAVIISTIKKGNAKLGLRYIPIFIFVSITLFFIADIVLGKLLGVIL